jgi:Flp pilus assembly protein TadG
MLLGCHQRLLRFRRDQRGVSAVEFALLLPLMLVIYLGSVEVSQAISIDRKVSLTARTVADLVARSSGFSKTEMTNILNAATTVLTPYPAGSLKLKVSQVYVKADGTSTIDWGEAKNDTKRTKGETVTVPAGLKIAGQDSYLIWAEVQYGYTPTIGYVLTGSWNLTDQIYMRPRVSTKVAEPT